MFFIRPTWGNSNAYRAYIPYFFTLHLFETPFFFNYNVIKMKWCL